MHGNPGFVLPSLLALLLTASVCAQEEAESDAEDKKARMQAALAHMQAMEMRLARGGDVVPLLERPLLTYGDSARSNENGTLWAFGKTGRPLALLELYQPTGRTENWVHAVTLTSLSAVTMKTPVAAKWTPETTQVSFKKITDAAAPAERESARLRQLKDLARRFDAHEFWDPDNSRFELRLLVQPVHRYHDAKAGIHDGAAFVLAHGTNPEIVLLIEAQGETLEKAAWHYGFARVGSAEMHVALDGKEVWKQNRTPGVAGRSIDPYWLFLSPAERRE